MRLSVIASSLLLAALAAPTGAQTALPAATEVSWPALRSDLRHLLDELDREKAALPAATTRELKALLAKKPADADAAAAAVQKLLDAHCLVGVSINPESRVKAMRGPARAVLVRDQATAVLVKVVNEAGVTHRLAVSGPGLLTGGKPRGGRWLEAKVGEGAAGGKLNGRRLEYRVLWLTAREAGKREATLVFDVGQGTQDLGFRAEVPILFSVRTD